MPVCLHPNGPSQGLFKPFHGRGLDGPIYSFGVETGLNLLRRVISSIFEKFPNPKVVVGHLGETLPFWINRIDYMYGKQIATGRYAHVKPPIKKPSEYLKENVWDTTSGMPWQDEVMFVRKMVGADRVMRPWTTRTSTSPAKWTSRTTCPSLTRRSSSSSRASPPGSS